MDEHNDIFITNCANNKNIVINYIEKNLKGKDLYELLSFDDESIYLLENNYDDIDDGQPKEYFKELIDLFGDILKEVSKLNYKESDDQDLDSSNRDI